MASNKIIIHFVLNMEFFMSNYKNSFYLQAFISSCPAILIVAFFPTFLKNFDNGTSVLGISFFLIRLGFIVGGFFVPFLLNHKKPHVISGMCELLCFILSLIILLAYKQQLTNIFISLIFFRFTLNGIINVTRFSWLKNLEVKHRPREIYLFTVALMQSTYAVAGLFYLFGTFNQNVLEIIIFCDSVTSLIGAILFFNLDAISSNVKSVPVKLFQNHFKEKRRFTLLLADMLLAFSLSGTNYLLVEYGENYFSKFGGYGTTLLIYAGFYFLGGQAMTTNYALIKRFNFQIMKYSSFGIVIGFLLFLFSKSNIILVIGFALIFISYPIALLSFEKSWFDLLDKENASAVYAYRYLIISLIWAIGEIIFSSLINNDNQVRLLFSIVSSTVFIHYCKNQCR